MTPEQFSKHSSVKFRPVLTLAQMQHIAEMCHAAQHQESDGYETSASILKVLVPMIAKIEVGAITPAYKLSEHHIAKQFDKSERERYESGLMGAEEELLYEAKILGT